MAAANGVSGDGGAQARGAERERGGDEDEEVGERVRGDAWRRMEASRALGTQAARQEVARARVHARRARALPTGLGRKTTGEVEVGWASTGYSAGPHSRLPGECLSFFYLFLFSIFCNWF